MGDLSDLSTMFFLFAGGFEHYKIGMTSNISVPVELKSNIRQALRDLK